MREFKIIMLNKKGVLVTEYEMFSSLESANNWANKKNAKKPGSVIDITLMNCNEELKYEY